MDIRVNSEYFTEIQKAYKESDKLNKDVVKLNQDENVDIPVIMVSTENGEFQAWTRGFENIMSFLKYGYVKVSDGKYCPLIKGKCKGEKCALYLIENSTGDCSLKWTGIMSILNNKGAA